VEGKVNEKVWGSEIISTLSTIAPYGVDTTSFRRPAGEPVTLAHTVLPRLNDDAGVVQSEAKSVTVSANGGGATGDAEEAE